MRSKNSTNSMLEFLKKAAEYKREKTESRYKGHEKKYYGLTNSKSICTDSIGTYTSNISNEIINNYAARVKPNTSVTIQSEHIAYHPQWGVVCS